MGRPSGAGASTRYGAARATLGEGREAQAVVVAPRGAGGALGASGSAPRAARGGIRARSAAGVKILPSGYWSKTAEFKKAETPKPY